MIIKEIFYAIQCDRCGNIDESDDSKFWSEESTAIENAMENEWNITTGKHYCPDCFSVNEETEEVTIKPLFPQSVKKIEKFINIITKNCAEIHESDIHFYIKFYERIPLGIAEHNWLKTCFPDIAIDRTPNRQGNNVIITIRK